MSAVTEKEDDDSLDVAYIKNKHLFNAFTVSVFANGICIGGLVAQNGLMPVALLSIVLFVVSCGLYLKGRKKV